MFTSLKKRLASLTILVLLAAWQVYAGFERLFAMTTQEMQSRNNDLWFFSGPISFFLASALGILFSLAANFTRKSEGRKFWSIALWVPSFWLLLSGIIFLYLDWFGHTVHWNPIEHLRNAFAIAAPMLGSVALLAGIALSIRKLPVAAAVYEPEGWRKALAVGSKILAWLSLVMGSLLAVLASALVLLMPSCTPPSLPSLAKRFQQNDRTWNF